MYSRGRARAPFSPKKSGESLRLRQPPPPVRMMLDQVRTKLGVQPGGPSNEAGPQWTVPARLVL
jgi:hypothetical protein